MFPDSQIAEKFACCRKSCTLHNYKDNIMNQLKEVPFFSVSFDESYNKITKNEQMDLNIRFWSEKENKITSRYLGSPFRGHATAKELLKHFNDSTALLQEEKILQVSMDGPSVNMKLHYDLLSHRETVDSNLPILLDIGSCGLHVIYGAFRTAFQNTG